MEKTNEALGNYKATLDDVFEAKREKEWNKYSGGIENRLSKFDQKVASRVIKDSERLIDNDKGLKRKVGRILAVGMLAASSYLGINHVPIEEYTVQPGDGFSNVAYELNLPNSAMVNIAESYESTFGERVLHPDRTATRYLSGIRWE